MSNIDSVLDYVDGGAWYIHYKDKTGNTLKKIDIKGQRILPIIPQIHTKIFTNDWSGQVFYVVLDDRTVGPNESKDVVTIIVALDEISKTDRI